MTVNIIQDVICMRFIMFNYQVVTDPGHKMVFKCAFDQLVKDIRGKYLVNISTVEVIGEWLHK